MARFCEHFRETKAGNFLLKMTLHSGVHLMIQGMIPYKYTHRLYCAKQLLLGLGIEGTALHARYEFRVKVPHSSHSHTRHSWIVQQSIPSLLQLLHCESAGKLRASMNSTQVIRLKGNPMPCFIRKPSREKTNCDA
jgi:hypothetical protein